MRHGARLVFVAETGRRARHCRVDCTHRSTRRPIRRNTGRHRQRRIRRRRGGHLRKRDRQTGAVQRALKQVPGFVVDLGDSVEPAVAKGQDFSDAARRMIRKNQPRDRAVAAAHKPQGLALAQKRGQASVFMQAHFRGRIERG